MSSTPNGSLYQAANAYAETHDSVDTLVHLSDLALYTTITDEAFMQLPQAAREKTVAIVDARTAATSHGFEAVSRDLDRILIVGAPEIDQAMPDNATLVIAASGDNEVYERFCIIHGPSLRFAAALGEEPSGDSVEPDGFWTAFAPCVDALARDYPAAIPENGAELAHEQQERGVLRIVQAMRRHYRAEQRQAAAPDSELDAVLNVLKAISIPGSIHDVLYVFVEQIALTIEVDRCSVVRVKNNASTGKVLASHEDERVHDREIDLDKYPEIRRALKTGELIAISDVARSDVMRTVREDMIKAGFSAVMVVPIILFDNNMGSLLLRVARKRDGFTPRDTDFCEIVAESAANALERAHLIEAIQGANERLERLAITDGLTGLYNFRFFRDRLDKEYSRSDRYGNPLSCILIDIDDFKRVNDTYGHLQGDEILKDIAALTLKSFRQSDIVARYGGEELVALLPQTSMAGAIRQAERLRQAIESTAFEGLPKGSQVTVSVGVSQFSKDTMNNCEDLVRSADEGLYAAKERGKNQVVALQKESS